MPIKITNLEKDFISLNYDKNIEGVDIEIDCHGSIPSKQHLNYTVSIKFDLKTEDNEFKDTFKNTCKMPFAPYNFKTQKYNFFTSKYTSQNLQDRVDILQNIINVCSNQAKLNNENIVNAQNFFKEKFNDLEMFEFDGILCLPVKSLQSLVVIPTRYLGTNEFSKYIKISSEFKKVTSLPIDVIDEINELSGNLVKPNTSAFIVNQELIEKFINTIKNDADASLNFKSQQQEIGKSLSLNKYDIEEKNPFDLKIKYDDSNGCFHFYCKGYVDSVSPFGEMAPRNLVGKWAFNFILSTTDESLATPKFYRDLSPTETYKINLKCLSGSSAKSKDLLIPAEQHDRIKLIYDGYQTQKELWSREPVVIKLPFRNLNLEDNASYNPFIYFQDDGQALFIYNIKHSNHNAKSEYLKMSGFKVSKDEVHKYLYEHPFSKEILAGTKYALGTLENSGTISNALNEELFEKTYSVYKLRNELNLETKKTKKLKI